MGLPLSGLEMSLVTAVNCREETQKNGHEMTKMTSCEPPRGFLDVRNKAGSVICWVLSEFLCFLVIFSKRRLFLDLNFSEIFP